MEEGTVSFISINWIFFKKPHAEWAAQIKFYHNLLGLRSYDQPYCPAKVCTTRKSALKRYAFELDNHFASLGGSLYSSLGCLRIQSRSFFATLLCHEIIHQPT
jgi:hypothetical protein